jgi:hypothetical protein
VQAKLVRLAVSGEVGDDAIVISISVLKRFGLFEWMDEAGS